MAESKQKSGETKAEIMSPVGSFESLAAAINAGCGSVYFGVEQLNMRARSSYNFSIDEIGEVTKRAKAAGVRTYVTMNTLLYEHDMALMKKILDKAKEVGVDAVIIADVAAMQYAREIGLPVHASTQLSISNYDSVRFYANFADTVVLAREVDLNMIKTICDSIKRDNLKGPGGELVKVEIFVHGALCVAQSGRCQMSLISNNTSAQRGACLQECRKKYRIIDEESGTELIVDNQYVLSPKDLCTVEFLDKIVDAGVSVFKIEGRGKTADYVDVVTRVYKEAVDAIADGTYGKDKIEDWMKRLGTVYNRGFSDGYYLGKPLADWSGHAGNRATDERVFVGIAKHYFPQAGIAEIALQAHPVKIGDRLMVMGGTTGMVQGEVTSLMIDEQMVENAQHPAIVTLPFSEKIRPNDKVFLLKERVQIS